MSDNKMAAWRPWANLPAPLLQFIFNGLDKLIDRVRFIAVCHSFRSMVIELEPKSYLVSSPLLLLPPPISGDSPIREFYSFSNRTTYQSFIPELQGKWCCGSSFGWLFTVDLSSEKIILINPMTQSEIYLPPLSKFTDPPELDGLGHPRNNIWFIYRTSISSSPSTSQDFIVMALITNLKILAFCKAGIDKWFNLPSIQGPGEDFRYYRGRFYVITNWGAVITWDLRDPYQPISTTIIEPNYDAYDIVCRRYLIESINGELLKVCKDYEFPDVDVDDDEEDDYFHSTVFTVSGLDEEHEGWVQRSLSRQAVFLGCNTTICVSTLENPEFDENGIYFTDDNAGKCYHDDPKGCNNVGFYNLKEGEVSSVYDQNHSFWTSACIWVTPSL